MLARNVLKKYPRMSYIKVKTRDIRLLVICSDIPQTQILHHVATSQLNCYKIQITDF